MTTTVDDRLMATWAVWGMVATVLVAEPGALAEACRLTRDELAGVDAAASRFRPDSELSVINASAGRWVPVSELLAELLGRALDAAELTGGAVDPTLGAALRGLGYDRDIALVLDDARRIAVRYLGPRWREVRLDRVGRRVRVPAGVELDLGATAKAIAADRAATAASSRLGTPVLVNLGGDLAVSGCAGAETFTVVLAEDHRDEVGPLVRVGDGGMATSTTRLRRWRADGMACHHLLDPDTGQPAGGPWRTVTVAAASCRAANIASTAAIVKGGQGLAWLRGTGLPARLVGAAGRVRTVNGWPEDGC